MAGDDAGALTNKGALLLDPSGEFSAGAAVCPPEGDAGTGMAATGSVLERTGNVSAGTSIFAMTVLERPLKKVYPEIDVVATPDGKPVAMVHCNNCLGDFDAWVGVFAQFAKKTGFTGGMGELYELMFRSAGEGSADCGGVTVYNYLGGEPVTGLEAGAPMVLRDPDAHFTFDNLMRAQLYSAMAALAVGMRRLEEEDAVAQVMYGHGGLFKTKDVGQRMLASALGMPVAVRETAGEGGPWGMALLAAYMLTKGEGQTLSGWLGEKVFRGGGAAAMPPDEKAAAGFKKYLDRYEALLDAEKTAVAKRRAFEEK
jgi:sugar (pentulose or hexulose) kinase